MSDETTVDEVLEKLSRWMAAKADLRKASDSCRYDFSYFCSQEIEAEQEARADVARALEAFVDARLKVRA